MGNSSLIWRRSTSYYASARAINPNLLQGNADGQVSSDLDIPCKFKESRKSGCKYDSQKESQAQLHRFFSIKNLLADIKIINDSDVSSSTEVESVIISMESVIDCCEDHSDNDHNSIVLFKELFKLVHVNIDSEDHIMKSIRVIRKFWEGNSSLKNINSLIEISEECNLLINLLSHYKSSPEILIEICQTIKLLCNQNRQFQILFGSSGVSEIFIILIPLYIPSQATLIELLTTCITLCNGCQDIQNQFHKISMTESIQSVSQTYGHSETVMEYLCDFIISVTQNHVDNQTIFMINKLPEIFSHLYKQFPFNTSLQIKICKTISLLCTNHPINQHTFANFATCHMLLMMWKKQKHEKFLIGVVSDAIWSLVEDNFELQGLFRTARIWTSIFSIWSRYYNTDAHVTERICSILTSIGYQNREVQLQFSQARGSRTLANILEFYLVSNEDIISRCCDVVCAMVVGNHNNQSQIAITSLPKTLVSILMYDGVSAMVIEKIFATIWALAANHSYNQAYFRELHTVDIVFRLLYRYQDCSQVVRVIFGVLWAIADECTASNAKEGLSVGLQQEQIILLLTTLQRQKTVPAVAIQGLWALQRLATNNPKNQVLIGENQGCELLVELIIIHQSIEEVVGVGAGAIWALTFNNEANREKFGGCGCCELMVRLLEKETNSAKAVENLCGVIWSMSMSHKENQNKLGDLGACELLVEILLKYENKKKVIDLTMGAMESLCWNHDNNRLRCRNAAGVKQDSIEYK